MNLAYIIPTRNRPHELRRTLESLAQLPPHSAQILVIDNASSVPPTLPPRLPNGLSIQLIRHRANLGAAARNTGAAAADPSCEWLIMLDDDSAPLSLGHVQALRETPRDVAAVAAEIFLARTSRESGPKARAAPITRESGGLPEVFIGCGVAIRRAAFLECGGYDPSFGFYAEEYDLAAKFLLSGLRVTLDRRFAVEHRKVSAVRDTNLIMQRLIRNNGWVMQRYAPARRRGGELARTIARYSAIARKEHAETGCMDGLSELMRTLPEQRRMPMPTALWDRFTGKAAARTSLQQAFSERPFRTAAIVDEGKNAHIIRAVLHGLGVREVTPEHSPEALVIGTLSPGPMLDAWERRTGGAHATRRLLCAWGMPLLRSSGNAAARAA